MLEGNKAAKELGSQDRQQERRRVEIKGHKKASRRTERKRKRKRGSTSGRDRVKEGRDQNNGGEKKKRKNECLQDCRPKVSPPLCSGGYLRSCRKEEEHT